MRTLVLDDTVIATLDRAIAGNSDYRVCMDARGDWRVGDHLKDRVV
jgi:hypothetical protein